METKEEHTEQTTDSVPEAKSELQYERIPLGEWGPQLPVGVFTAAGGKSSRDLAHRRWNLNLEKEISKLREQNKTANFAKFASIVMSHVYEQIGPVRFQAGVGLQKSTKAQWARSLAEIGHLTMPDALYAYIWLRRQVMGNEVPMTLQCGRCGHSEPFTADLDTLEVKVVEKEEDTIFEYMLREPIKIRGKECTGFKVGVPSWNCLEAADLEGETDTGGLKSALIWGSIKEVLGEGLGGTAISERELGELGKYDFETLSTMINDNMPGADMSVEMDCRKCKASSLQSLDWMYDSFFGSSGRSRGSKK